MYVTLMSMNLYHVHVAITPLMTACAVCKIRIATIPVFKVPEGNTLPALCSRNNSTVHVMTSLNLQCICAKTIGKNGRKDCMYKAALCLFLHHSYFNDHGTDKWP